MAHCRRGCGARHIRRRSDGFRKCACGFLPRRIVIYPDGIHGAPVVLTFAHPADEHPLVCHPFDGIQPHATGSWDPVSVLAGWRGWQYDGNDAPGEIPKIDVASLPVPAHRATTAVRRLRVTYFDGPTLEPTDANPESDRRNADG